MIADWHFLKIGGRWFSCTDDVIKMKTKDNDDFSIKMRMIIEHDAEDRDDEERIVEIEEKNDIMILAIDSVAFPRFCVYLLWWIIN